MSGLPLAKAFALFRRLVLVQTAVGLDARMRYPVPAFPIPPNLAEHDLLVFPTRALYPGEEFEQLSSSLQ